MMFQHFFTLAVHLSVLIWSLSMLFGPSSETMKPYAFNASDYCAMRVIVRCFASSKMGLPHQTCGAQSVLDLAREGVGNRNSCMQATKITKWLQTTMIDTEALKSEIMSDCGAFRQISDCIRPFEEQCKQTLHVFGLTIFLNQWTYICSPRTYPRLEKHIICRREVPASAFDECRHFAPVLGIDYENSTVTGNMSQALCTKFKLILGCKASVLLSSCARNSGLLAAQFLIDFFNIQSESLDSSCLIKAGTDPVKLGSIYEKYVAELAEKTSSEEDTRTTTPTITTTAAITTTPAPTAIIKIQQRANGERLGKPARRPLLPFNPSKFGLPGGDKDDIDEDTFFSSNELGYDYYDSVLENDTASLLSLYSHSVVLLCLVFHLLVTRY